MTCPHTDWIVAGDTEVSRIFVCGGCLMATRVEALPPKRLAATVPGFDDVDVSEYRRGETVLAKRIITATGNLDGVASFAIADGPNPDGPVAMPREMYERMAFEAGYVIVGVVQ